MLEKTSLLNDLVNCSFHNWHELFEKNSVKSYCLKVPQDVVKYFQDDSFFLPKECNIDSVTTRDDDNFVGDDELNFDDEDTEVVDAPSFPEFSAKILKTIEKLGGSAFIKTNWHSPKDSIWITAGQTMRVQDLNDVYQLLKASSICKDDFSHLENPDNYYLVFKKWKDIHPGTEFRCFVRTGNLIAISPRDWPQYHAHLCTQKQDIIKDIVSLFKEKIKERFPSDNCKF